MKTLLIFVFALILGTNIVYAEKVSKPFLFDDFIDKNGPPQETRSVGNKDFYVYTFRPNANDPLLTAMANKQNINKKIDFRALVAQQRLDSKCEIILEVNEDNYIINYWEEGDACE